MGRLPVIFCPSLAGFALCDLSVWSGAGWGIQFGGQLTPDSAQGQQEVCLSATVCVSEQKQRYLCGRDGIASHLTEIIG